MSRSAAWVSLSAIGLTAGVAAALAVGDPLAAVVGMMLVTPLLTGIVGGVLGAAQLLHLRRVAQVPVARWLLATTLGLGTGLAVGVVIVEQLGTLLMGARPHVLQLPPFARAIALAVVGLTSGVMLGFAQSLVLRAALPTLRRWALVSASALSVGFGLASLAVDAVLGSSLASPIGLLSFLLLAGIIYGTVTAPRLQRAA